MPSSAHRLPPPPFPTRRSSDLRFRAGPVRQQAEPQHLAARLVHLEQHAAPTEESHAAGLAERQVTELERRLRKPPLGRPLREIVRSEEHTSELQSPCKLVCRLLPTASLPPLSLHDALPIFDSAPVPSGNRPSRSISRPVSSTSSSTPRPPRSRTLPASPSVRSRSSSVGSENRRSVVRFVRS